MFYLSSKLMTVSLQGTVDLIPMCPLFRGSTVLQGTVDLIPICLLFRGSTVLQGSRPNPIVSCSSVCRPITKEMEGGLPLNPGRGCFNYNPVTVSKL